MRALFSLFLDLPRTVILLLLLPTLFFASFLPRLRKDNDVMNMLPQGHPIVRLTNQIEEEFGVRDSVLVGVVTEGPQGIFNSRTLELIQRLTEGLESLPEIRSGSVKGLFTIDTIIGTEDGFEVKPLLEEVPRTPEAFRRLRARIEANRMLRGEIVSPDGTAALILGDPEPGIDQEKLYYRLRELVSSQAPTPSDRVFIAGVPVFTGVIGTYVSQDMERMIPFVGLVIVSMLAFLLRSIRGVLLPLLVIGFGVVWAMGSMAMCGIPIYPITTIIPVLIMALGCADGIHILNRYYEARRESADRPGREIILETMDEMWQPVVMTSLTTTVGFLSLLGSEIDPLRFLGVFSAVGIMAAMVFSLAFIPASLALFESRDRRSSPSSLPTRTPLPLSSPGPFQFAGKTIYIHRYPVVFINLILLVGALAVLPALRIDSDPLRYFNPGSEIPAANDMINEKFNGIGLINVVVDGGKPDAFKSPALLERLDRLERAVKRAPDVGGTVSLADYLKLMNRAMHGDDASWEILPQTRAEISQYLLLYSFSGDPEDLERVVDDAYRTADLIVRLKTLSSNRIGRVAAAIEDRISEIFGDGGILVQVGGKAMVTYVTQQVLVKGQINSILLSLLGVLFITALMFRSLLAGVLCVLPIAIATLWNFGFMSLARLPLEPASAVTSCIGIGVGIDYAIHFIAKYRYLTAHATPRSFLERDPKVVYREVTVITVSTAGKAILFNALVVVCGFLVLLVSNFPPTRTMGILVSLNMFTCCLGALTLLPAAVNIFRPRFCCRIPWELRDAGREGT